MMKCEFDKLMGLTTVPECYERIEYVYTHCPLFSETNGKAEIAEFYKRFDMKGINRLYHALKEIFALMKKDDNYDEPWQVIREYAEKISETEMDYHSFLDRAGRWWPEYKRLAFYGSVALTYPERKEKNR